ncbi:MAG: hypothetical protein HYV53_02340 [Parcubacteria group bacterium]|nr:hypothetical protein [Parcubacteria group bacterium]
MNKLDRIGVLVLVDPGLGITIKDAKAALDACLEFNGDGLPLSRICVTAQATTNTRWPELLDFIQYAAVERKQKSAVRVFSDLQGMTEDKAREIRNLGALLFGEWFAPSLDQRGIKAMVQQGISTAGDMLEGIKNSLKAKALTGIEFQINKNNFQYVGEFIKSCNQLEIEPHLEMQEVKFSREQKNLADWRREYLDLLPPKSELQKIARLTGENIPLSPFFCSGNNGLQYGVCNYWFENGVFIRSNGRGGLLRTACLSDTTPVDSDFVPTTERLRRNLAHPLLAMRKSLRQKDMAGTKCAPCSFWDYCRGGCRAMAFLAANNDFSPDPNCWYGEKGGK